MISLLQGLTVFLIAFLMGYFIVPEFGSGRFDPSPQQTTERLAQPVVNTSNVVNPLGGGDFVPEFRDLPNYNEIEYPEFNVNLLDVHSSGDIFIEEDVTTKSGESWLTLVEKKTGNFLFETSKAKVTKFSTPEMGDGNVKLSFNSASKPLLAVRRLKSLLPGKVTTLYHRPMESNDNSDSMEDGYHRQFEFNGVIYVLRVAKGITKDGDRIGLLLLGNGIDEQIIDRSPYYPGTNTDLGKLLWIGDLDRDGQPDIYLDRSLGEEKSGTGLFLSSHAAPGKQVKLVALFGHSGC